MYLKKYTIYHKRIYLNNNKFHLFKQAYIHSKNILETRKFEFPNVIQKTPIRIQKLSVEIQGFYLVFRIRKLNSWIEISDFLLKIPKTSTEFKIFSPISSYVR